MRITEWKLQYGFSGTNDNHRLPPLSVTQREPDVPELIGTNGKLIDLFLKHACGYEVLKEDDVDAGIIESHALIDTGALLAGIPTHNVAQHLIEQNSFSTRGVTYYDTRKMYNG